MLDWLIVGGGIHGTYLSHVFTTQAGVPHHRIRVLDPHSMPLALWEAYTTNIGMEYLRSPCVHSLDPDPYAMIKFAQTREGSPHARFTEPYRRPALDLFRAHTHHLIQHGALAELRIVGRAKGLSRHREGFRVETAAGSLEARRVLLALGMTEQPSWPAWANDLRATGASIHHVFDPTFRLADIPDWSHIVVIGGGISAVQTALTLAYRAPGTVSLLMRHELRIHQFDSDAGWLGPKYLKKYHQEPDVVQRRALIQSARHRGSIPPDVAQALHKAIKAGYLVAPVVEIDSAALDKDGKVLLQLRGEPASLCTDQIVLATGFKPQRPGGVWLDRAIADLGLPCARCGYPIVEPSLCWYPGLYVTGPLAELELGPAARNIAGARMAAERLLKRAREWEN